LPHAHNARAPYAAMRSTIASVLLVAAYATLANADCYSSVNAIGAGSGSRLLLGAMLPRRMSHWGCFLCQARKRRPISASEKSYLLSCPRSSAEP
jgi:hypothetical protein